MPNKKTPESFGNELLNYSEMEDLKRSKDDSLLNPNPSGMTQATMESSLGQPNKESEKELELSWNLFDGLRIRWSSRKYTSNRTSTKWKKYLFSLLKWFGKKFVVGNPSQWKF